MKIQHYTMFIGLIMANSAFCATKSGLSDELYEQLRKTDHRVHYESLLYDQENVWDISVVLKNTAHTPDYTGKVIAIDHKGETITIEQKKPAPPKKQKKKAAEKKGR